METMNHKVVVVAVFSDLDFDMTGLESLEIVVHVQLYCNQQWFNHVDWPLCALMMLPAGART